MATQGLVDGVEIDISGTVAKAMYKDDASSINQSAALHMGGVWNTIELDYERLQLLEQLDAQWKALLLSL